MNRQIAKFYMLEIKFPIAMFKIPYTVKTRNTYLIPRKKSIISIFNSFFEVPISFWKFKGKKKIEKEEKIIKDFLVGAELENFTKSVELQRIVQVKDNRSERIISYTEILNEVKYNLYLIPPLGVSIKNTSKNYYPFGGQNDYLASEWKLSEEEGEIIEIENQEIYIQNYQLLPKEFEPIEKKSEIIIEGGFENYYVGRGTFKVKSKQKILKFKEKIIFLY